MTKRYLKYVNLLGIFLFIYIIAKIDHNKAAEGISHFDWKWFLIYCGASILVLVFKSIRWKIALQTLEIHYSFPIIFKITVNTIFWGIITPGRIGEFGKIFYLQKGEVPFAKGILSILIDRLHDIVILLIMGIISFFYFLDLFAPDLKAAAWILGILILLAFSIYISRKDLWLIIKKVLKYLLSEDKYSKVSEEWGEFRVIFFPILIRSYGKMFVFTLSSSVFVYAQIFCVARGFGVEVPIFYLVMCMSLGSILALIPISIGGLGTREALYIYLLAKVSVLPEKSVLISFMDSSVFAIFIVGVVAFIVNRLVKK